MRTVITLLCTLCLLHLQAQEQFADRVVRYSSQAGSKAYSAKQVLGKPNALQYGKNPVAWAPSAPNIGLEYIEVSFRSPMSIKQVAIWENLNPGAIFEIHLIETNGKNHKVFSQDKPSKQGGGNRVFRYMMKPTNYKVSSVKVVLNTAGVYGLNQIDAIGISASDKPMDAKINIPQDKQYAGKPENLGYTVNSEDPDLLPIITPDGQWLFFARKKHINNLGPQRNDDIYISSRTSKGSWSEARNINIPLNNEHNNFVCAVNPDGTELLISGRYEHRGVTHEGLHRSRLTNGQWSSPTPIKIDNYNNLSPFVCYHVSPDLKYLVMAMEHPDTYGDMDIYVSTRISADRYSAPRNVGPIINTAGTEPSVFLSADSKTIYFASDGHPGYGAYDMYMSRRLDNSWTRWTDPVNLGPGINTEDWDLYYTVTADGEYAYYSSEYNSYGRSDLYRIKLPRDVRPEPVALVKTNYSNINPNTPTANIQQETRTVVVQDDSALDLFEEVKGFYPVNREEDLSAQYEEVDDFEEAGTDGIDPEEAAMDQKMEDLLARLQELKKEQAVTEQAVEETKIEVAEPAKTTTTSTAPPQKVLSDLDERLAELRSNMDRIEQGREVPVKTDKKEVPVAVTYDDDYEVPEEEDPFTTSQREILERYKDDYERTGRYVSPSTSQRSSPYTPRQYVAPAREEDEFANEMLNYRDQIEALKQQKSSVRVTARPMSKEALASSGIDTEQREELVASSLDTDLASIRDQKEEEEIAPEVLEMRKKLEALKADKTPDAPTSRTRPKTNTDEAEEQEVAPEVLALQEKLAAMKADMENLPRTAGQADNGSLVEEAEPEIITAMAEPVGVEEGNGRKERTKRKKQTEVRIAPETAGDPEKTEVAEIIQPEVEALATVIPEADELEPVSQNEVEIQTIETDLPEVDTEAVQRAQQELEELQQEQSLIKTDVDKALQDKAAIEEERNALAEEKEALEAQKQALQDLIADMEAQRQAFLDEQAKLRSDKDKLEQLRLQQHQEVKKLEQDIAALEAEKGQALEAATAAKSKAPVVNTTPGKSSEVFLMPIEKGVAVEMRNVFFNANSAYIKPVSYRSLDQVVAFLKVNSNITVEIGGHTNGLCDTQFCNQLSAKRARSVYDYILAKGIPEGRLSYKGYGKTQPIEDNRTSSGRKANQRVELKIMEVN